MFLLSYKKGLLSTKKRFVYKEKRFAYTEKGLLTHTKQTHDNYSK